MNACISVWWGLFSLMGFVVLDEVKISVVLIFVSQRLHQ